MAGELNEEPSQSVALHGFEADAYREKVHLANFARKLCTPYADTGQGLRSVYGRVLPGVPPYAVVNFFSVEAAERAIQGLNGIIVPGMGRDIVLRVGFFKSGEDLSKVTFV